MKVQHGHRAAPAFALAALVSVFGASALVSVGAAAAPPAPTNLTSFVTGTSVTLDWRAATGTKTNVIYSVEWGTSSGASNTEVWQTALRYETINNLASGRHYFRVRALYPGSPLSEPSNEVMITVGGASCTAPAAPTGFAVTVAGTSVAFVWLPAAGATSYVFEAGSSAGASNLGTLSLTTLAYSSTSGPGTIYTRVRAKNSCGTSAPSAEKVVTIAAPTQPPPTQPPPTQPPPTQPPPTQPPPAAGSIYGTVDPVILGTCTAAQHDAFSVDGGDGFRYRTWHPQVDPSGCVYAHEHGDNPSLIQNAEIAASPVRFGYIGRRHPSPTEPNGHDEAHEGFKVFIANPGEVNNEGRRNRVYSRSVFHMGTGGPKRFNMPHHSAEIRVIHPEFGLKAFTQLMMDTGGLGTVCDPRKQAPVKDVMQLGSPCKLNSAYEIWSTTASVMHGGKEIYRSFATPAVFDPITVFNPSNPTELVYIWDARVNAIKNFPDDWTTNRGCARESYAQPGYWYNSRGPTVYYTDAMGQDLASSDPLSLRQEISASDSIAAPATSDGLVQFKMRKSYCQQSSKLGLKN